MGAGRRRSGCTHGSGFRSAIPGKGNGWYASLPGLGLFAAWLSVHVYAIWNPSLPPSMFGKREDCIFEVLIFALPGFALGIPLLRRYWPLDGLRSGMLLGLAAGVVSASAMQLACMVDPWHVLTHHVLPVLLPAALGAAIGNLLLRRS